MSYVQTAEAKMRQKEYNNNIRRISDYDAFATMIANQFTSLDAQEILDLSRAIMKDDHDYVHEQLVLIGNPNPVGIVISSGSNTAVTADKLEDDTADFVTDLVRVGDYVNNTDDETRAAVTAVDDLDTLSLDKDIFLAFPKAYEVVRQPSITLAVGETYQFKAYWFFGKTWDNVYHLPNSLARDATGTAEWIKDPFSSNVVTIENGLVTAANAGSCTIYAKIGDFETINVGVEVS